MVSDQSFSRLQNVTYLGDGQLYCMFLGVNAQWCLVPFPMSILDSFGGLLGFISVLDSDIFVLPSSFALK